MSVSGRGRREWLAGALVSLALHALALGVALGVDLPGPRADQAPRPLHPAVPVEVRREQARLIAEERARPAPAVEEAPTPEPKPELNPEPKPEPKPDPKPKPKPKPTPDPKPKPTPKPDPPPAAEAPPAPTPGPAVRAPLVLSNVSLSCGVAVQTGASSNVLGDPSVNAKGWKPGDKGRPGPGGEGASGAGEGEAPRKLVVVLPKPLNDVKGRYPDEHRDLRRVVRVELVLAVDASGAVTGARVVKGNLPAFDEQARQAARQLRFRPATRDGAPIPFDLKWTVVFLPESA